MADLWPDAEIGEMINDGVVLSFEAETAITLTKGYTIVTRNVEHFQKITGLTVITSP